MVLPRGSVKTDWEVELAVVIGKRARYITKEEALDHVRQAMALFEATGNSSRCFSSTATNPTTSRRAS